MAKYLAIKDNDIDNGPGLRVSVWFSGCPHKCKGCHNEESWDETKGRDFHLDTINKIIDMLDKDGLKQDLSILGGEPLAPYNVGATLELIRAVKLNLPETKIWIWTGYTIEQLAEMELPFIHNDSLLECLDDVDVIVDGRYVKAFHVDDNYRGSSNQRIINHKESIKTGTLTLL